MLDCPIPSSNSDKTDDVLYNLGARLSTLRVQSNPSEQLRSRHCKSQPLVDSADNVIDIGRPTRSLLMNPARLRTIEGTDDYRQAVFLFADMIDSSVLSQKMSSRAFIDLLDPVLSGFQEIVDQYGTPHGISIVKLEGDCIMLAAASHLPEETQKHVEMMIFIGHKFSNFMSSHNEQKKVNRALPLFDFRFGIDIGEATKTCVRIRDANGLREQKDWSGNAANRASRMESTSHPNQVQLTDAIYEIAKKHFDFSTPSMRPIKGYGQVSTRFLIMPRKEFLDKHNITTEHQPLQKISSSSTEFPRKVLGSNRSSSANH